MARIPSSSDSYLRASRGDIGVARKVKAAIYAEGKDDTSATADAGVLARSEARTERTATAEPGAHPTGLPQVEADKSPINNMGVTTDRDATPDSFQDIAIDHYVELVMADSGEVKQVMTRIPTAGQCAIIDWVNFTVLEDTWFKTARETMIDDESIMIEASRYLEKIFGFGITLHRERGMNFYRDSWVLGDDFGFVCFGGQRATMLITLNGHGCINAAQGWEKRLYDFLTKVAIRPVISRVDLAHDDFAGDYLSVDWAESQWWEGGFTMSTGGQPPSIERVGNWHKPSGKGRTLTIGRRTSGKFLRVYEKGKKEGDKQSLWCRAEAEYKSSDRIIPFDVLINPSDYFAATYPCFSQFVQVTTPVRIKVKQKTAVTVIDACIEVTRHQFGKYLRVFRDLYGDKEALDLVCSKDKNAWPKRMKPLGADIRNTDAPQPIHSEAHVIEFKRLLTIVPSFGLHGNDDLQGQF